jgi:hypothetical protein
MADDVRVEPKDPRDESPAVQPPPAVPAVTSQGQPQRFRDEAGYDPVTQTGAGAGAPYLQPPEQSTAQQADFDTLQPVDEGTPRSIVRRDPAGEQLAPPEEPPTAEAPAPKPAATAGATTSPEGAEKPPPIPPGEPRAPVTNPKDEPKGKRR